MSPRSRAQRADEVRDPDAVGIGSVVVVLLLTTAMAYLPVRRSDYVQDDHIAVEDNAVVERGDVVEILTTHYWEGARGEDRTLYRPVTIASYAAERRVTVTPNSLVSHGFNLALHIATSLMVLALARRLGAGMLTAGLSAMLFAVHPIHVEAVAGIVGRAEILATLFCLLALWTYTFAGRWPPGSHPDRSGRNSLHRIAAWATAIFVLLALGSKEVAVATLPLLLLLDVLFRFPGARRERLWWVERAASLAPVALVCVVYVVLRVHALGAVLAIQHPHPIDNLLVEMDGPQRVATALGLLARYAWLLIFPVRLAADYSGEVISPESGLVGVLPATGIVLLSLLILLAVLPFLERRWPRPPGDRSHAAGVARLAAFGSFLFLVPYLVVGNLVVLVGAVFAERFMYLPSVGFCLLFGLFLGTVASGYPAFPQWSAEQRLRYALVVAGILLTAFTMLTYTRAAVWRDDRSVFEAVAQVHPESPRAQFVLGKLALDDGRPEDALEYLARAIELSPRHVPSHLEAGNALARLGRFEEAAAYYREATRQGPAFDIAHLNLGLAEQRMGRLDEAERAIRKALLLYPELAKGWAALGHVRYQAGRQRGALDAYRRAVALGRDDLAARVRELQRSEPPRPGSAGPSGPAGSDSLAGAPDRHQRR